MAKISVDGSSCESDGHPADCQETVAGTTEDSDGDTSVTIDGSPITTQADSMAFPSHAHEYVVPDDPELDPYCSSFSSHNLSPDDDHSLTINGTPVVRKGDTADDPGGGTATVTGSGGNGSVTHTE
jgi:uncharacterized Zn-binding protein involved in type VI secretion